MNITETPWEAVPMTGGVSRSLGPGWVVNSTKQPDTSYGLPERVADFYGLSAQQNAERTAGCVNACVGIATPEDVTTYLEIARRALQEADLFDQCAEEMDLSDAEMLRLRDQLSAALGTVDV